MSMEDSKAPTGNSATLANPMIPWAALGFFCPGIVFAAYLPSLYGPDGAQEKRLKYDMDAVDLSFSGVMFSPDENLAKRSFENIDAYGEHINDFYGFESTDVSLELTDHDRIMHTSRMQYKKLRIGSTEMGANSFATPTDTVRIMLHSLLHCTDEEYCNGEIKYSLSDDSNSAEMSFVQHLKLWMEFVPSPFDQDPFFDARLQDYFDYVLSRFERIDEESLFSVMSALHHIVAANICYMPYCTALWKLIKDVIVYDEVYILSIFARTVKSTAQSTKGNGLHSLGIVTWYLELANVIIKACELHPILAPWIDISIKEFPAENSAEYISKTNEILTASPLPSALLQLALLIDCHTNSSQIQINIPQRLQIRVLLGKIYAVIAINGICNTSAYSPDQRAALHQQIYNNVLLAYACHPTQYILVLIELNLWHLLELLLGKAQENVDKYVVHDVINQMPLLMLNGCLGLTTCIQAISFFVSRNSSLDIDFFRNLPFYVMPTVSYPLTLILAAVCHVPMRYSSSCQIVTNWQPSDDYLCFFYTNLPDTEFDFLQFAVQITLYRQRGIAITDTMKMNLHLNSSWEHMIHAANMCIRHSSKPNIPFEIVSDVLLASRAEIL